MISLISPHNFIGLRGLSNPFVLEYLTIWGQTPPPVLTGVLGRDLHSAHAALIKAFHCRRILVQQPCLAPIFPPATCISTSFQLDAFFSRRPTARAILGHCGPYYPNKRPLQRHTPPEKFLATKRPSTTNLISSPSHPFILSWKCISPDPGSFSDPLVPASFPSLLTDMRTNPARSVTLASSTPSLSRMSHLDGAELSSLHQARSLPLGRHTFRPPDWLLVFLGSQRNGTL
ncbi:hypothetical protein NM688_g9049 [Phlebia brevispora]|uniref:Uncharacterized protein n=1 Tax=Phlebia brevispora TaxID=194682 RepID=A0ACC1RKN8_9APHY|nr:hypothetical protein NM688_g9049 [Phlebia brevispora]